MIYKWFNPSLSYAGYLAVSESDDERMQWYDPLMGVPLPASMEDWKPPLLEQYLGDGKKKRKPGIIGDSPSSGVVHLVSEKAANALSDIFEKHAKLYPVKLKDAPNENFYMVVVTTEIDCLDRDKSTGKRTGYEIRPEYFSSIHTWVFDESKLEGVDLFVLPDSKTTCYVSDRFKQRVIDAGLKGFGFEKEFWDEDPIIT
ncbi:imm11 family protein [Kangiella sediminilitoris]|uniref:Immunity MXAN-0049 protein domain-containing protein n=1 Tax=Kangiella sediminilitoris TaxID=1144748 RepID=A0A1B3B9Q8_9GAMM|nr:DUF1629 domain-containing protein [Kangiella sediminilitoris]AOE49525.1 hypothetical protein KS2013_802 [Kangiella sediminilitoris]